MLCVCWCVCQLTSCLALEQQWLWSAVISWRRAETLEVTAAPALMLLNVTGAKRTQSLFRKLLWELLLLRLCCSDDREYTHTHTHSHLCLCASYINLSFAVSTGVIYTAAVLDCEIKDSYWLTVHATDTGVPPRSASIQVFIQVCYYIFIWLMLHLSWHFVLSALFWLNVFFF